MYVFYEWYDHLLLRENGDAEKVEKAIKEHDFDTFKKFYDQYGNRFFPAHATIYDSDDEWIGEVFVNTRGGFNMITDSEYECG